MKHQQDAGRYRQWERSRRARFNVLMLDLAKMLPQYEEASKDRGNTALKWSKAEVVERAAGYIRALEELKAAGSVARKVRAVRRENLRLRELLRKEFAPEKTEQEFRALDFDGITSAVEASKAKRQASVAAADHVSSSEGGGSGLGSDVFVASIGVADDHCYSLRAPADDVATEVVAHEEEVVEEPSEQLNRDDSERELEEDSRATMQAKKSNEVQIQRTCRKERAKTPTPNSSAPSSSVMASPILIPSQQQPTGGFAFIPTAMPLILSAGGASVVNPQAFLIRPNLIAPPVNKLPLPRLGATTSLRTVNVLGSTPKPSIILPPRCKRRKKKVSKRKVDEASNSSDTNFTAKNLKQDNEVQSKATAPEVATAKAPTATTSDEAFTFGDLTRVDSILPDAILASEDPLEEEDMGAVETIDLTNEEEDEVNEELNEAELANAASDINSDTQRPSGKEKTDTSMTKLAAKKTHAREKKMGGRKDSIGTGRSKKSRSSYSIAALCQISVNIGGATSNGASGGQTVAMVDSPGVLSLAEESAGTGSPAGTPIPASSPPPPSSASSSKIQDLASSVDDLDALSPSKSFLTNFPLVSAASSVPSTSKQQEALASSLSKVVDKISDPSIQALETLDAEIKKLSARPEDTTSKAPTVKASVPTMPDLSVFDFNEGRPDTPAGALPPISSVRPGAIATVEGTNASVSATSKPSDSSKMKAPISTKSGLHKVEVPSSKSVTSSKTTSVPSTSSQRGDKTSYPAPPLLSSRSNPADGVAPMSHTVSLPPLTQHYDTTTFASTSTSSYRGNYHHHYYPALSSTAASGVMSSHFHHQGALMTQASSSSTAPLPNFPDLSSTHGSSYHLQPQHHVSASRYHGGSSGQPQAYSATSSQQDYLHSSSDGGRQGQSVPTNYYASSSRHYQYAGDPALPYASLSSRSHSSNEHIKGTPSDRKSRSQAYESSSRSKQAHVSSSHLPPDSVHQQLSRPEQLSANDPCQVMQNDQGKTFSVTHLVSSKNAHQLDQLGNVVGPSKKSSKRNQMPATTSASKPGKVPSRGEIKDGGKSTSVEPSKDESSKRHHLSKNVPRHQGSLGRGSSHKVKPPSSSSYSTDLLVSQASAFPTFLGPTTVMEAPMYDMGGLEKLTHSSQQPQQQIPPMPPPPPPPQPYPSHFTWADPPASTPLPFPAMSPSPAAATANLFGPTAAVGAGDIAAFDISATLFGHDAISGAQSGPSARHYQQQPQGPPSGHKSRSSHQQPPLPLPQECSTSLQQQSGRSNPSAPLPPPPPPPHSQPSQHDYLGPALFDGSQFLPLPTITPPIAPDDPSSYGMAAPPPPPPPPPGFAANMYPASTRQSPYKKGDPGHQLHPHAQQHHSHQHQHSMAPPGSSVTNFNLSTIFPEINVHSGKLIAAAAVPPPQPPRDLSKQQQQQQHLQQQQLLQGSKSSTGTAPATKATAANPADPRQLSTPDVSPAIPQVGGSASGFPVPPSSGGGGGGSASTAASSTSGFSYSSQQQ